MQLHASDSMHKPRTFLLHVSQYVPVRSPSRFEAFPSNGTRLCMAWYRYVCIS